MNKRQQGHIQQNIPCRRSIYSILMSFPGFPLCKSHLNYITLFSLKSCCHLRRDCFKRVLKCFKKCLKTSERALVGVCAYAWICRFFTPLPMPSLTSGWSGLTPLTMPGQRSWPPSVTTDCITWSLFSPLWPTTSSSKLRSSSATPTPLTCQVRLGGAEAVPGHEMRAHVFSDMKNKAPFTKHLGLFTCWLPIPYGSGGS